MHYPSKIFDVLVSAMFYRQEEERSSLLQIIIGAVDATKESLQLMSNAVFLRAA